MGPSSTTTPWMAPNVILHGPTTDFLIQNDIALTPRRMTQWPLPHAAAHVVKGSTGKDSKRELSYPRSIPAKREDATSESNVPWIATTCCGGFPSIDPFERSGVRVYGNHLGKMQQSSLQLVKFRYQANPPARIGTGNSVPLMRSAAQQQAHRRSTSECRLEILLEIVRC